MHLGVRATTWVVYGVRLLPKRIMPGLRQSSTQSGGTFRRGFRGKASKVRYGIFAPFLRFHNILSIFRRERCFVLIVLAVATTVVEVDLHVGRHYHEQLVRDRCVEGSSLSSSCPLGL